MSHIQCINCTVVGAECRGRTCPYADMPLLFTPPSGIDYERMWMDVLADAWLQSIRKLSERHSAHNQ